MIRIECIPYYGKKQKWSIVNSLQGKKYEDLGNMLIVEEELGNDEDRVSWMVAKFNRGVC